MRKWLTSMFMIALLAACSSTPTTAPVEEASPTPTAPSSGGGATTGGAGTGGVTGTQTPGGGMGSGSSNPLRDPNNVLSKRSVYFDYDSAEVRGDYRSMIEAHARYLQANRNARIAIQGNTDERGSREYNIALGQRRADAVRQMMRVLGATDQQIETVSFGKEKPKNPGHDESAYTENRRADIVYAGE